MINYVNCGAYSNIWINFEHINNLGIDALSVLAKQIQLVQQKMILADLHPLCLIEEKIKFSGEDSPSQKSNREILKRKEVSYGLFASFNEQNISNINYEPQLKVLQSSFRKSSLILPDFEILIKFTLFGFGFISFMILAKKIVEIRQLISEKLKEFNVFITNSIKNSQKAFILTYNDIYTILELIKNARGVISANPTKNNIENNENGLLNNNNSQVTANYIKENSQENVKNYASTKNETRSSTIMGSVGKKPKKEDQLSYLKNNTEIDINNDEKMIIVNVLLDYLPQKYILIIFINLKKLESEPIK